MPIPCHFDYQPSLSFLMLRSHNHINLVHSHRFCHTFHVPHAINGIYHKLSNSKQLGEENSMACSGSRLSQKPSLRREGFPRSSYRLSLRRDRDNDPWKILAHSLRREQQISPLFPFNSRIFTTNTTTHGNPNTHSNVQTIQTSSNFQTD